MAKVKTVEKRIWDTEGFAVVIKWGGKDVRSDFTGLPQYPGYERMAKNDMTVTEWKEKRFLPAYPGYDVDILNGNGDVCQGNTKLGSVRDSYSEE
jgi:hypothetical protein